jgi:hypothetical protein
VQQPGDHQQAGGDDRAVGEERAVLAGGRLAGEDRVQAQCQRDGQRRDRPEQFPVHPAGRDDHRDHVEAGRVQEFGGDVVGSRDDADADERDEDRERFGHAEVMRRGFGHRAGPLRERQVRGREFREVYRSRR